MLRDLGAEVIKIEPPSTGDDTRSLGPFLNDDPNPETSAPFLYLNQGKKSVTLNIAHPEARPIIKRLVADGVVIESFKPGYLSGLELDYESLSTINPKLIMASISYFGQEGPYSLGDRGYAFSGYMTGDSDRELKAGGYQSTTAASPPPWPFSPLSTTTSPAKASTSNRRGHSLHLRRRLLLLHVRAGERPPPTPGHAAHPHEPSRPLPLHPSPLQGRLGPRPLFPLLPRGPGRANRKRTPRRE